MNGRLQYSEGSLGAEFGPTETVSVVDGQHRFIDSNKLVIDFYRSQTNVIITRGKKFKVANLRVPTAIGVDKERSIKK